MTRDPQGLQSPRRGGLPNRRGVAARGAGEVHQARASKHLAPVVGAASPGIEPRGATRAAVAGPLRSALPVEFKAKVREMLPQFLGKIGPADIDLRKALLKFIADFANWDNAAQRAYLDASRALVRAAHGEEPPLVVDSFAGGGSIPLEALRLGCEAFANDLNPIPNLLKVLLEDVPRFGQELLGDVAQTVLALTTQLRKELAGLYPRRGPPKATAYVWARTVNCEAPNCGAAIPLLRSMWLSR